MPEPKEEGPIQQQSSLDWELRFRGMLENVRLIAIMIDTQGRLMFCNSYLLQLSGWAAEDVMGHSWFERFIPPAEREMVIAVFAEGVARQNFPTHYQSAIVTRSGQLRTIRWNNTVLRDSAGNVTGCAAIGEDITEKLELEHQYRQVQKLESVGRLTGAIAHDFNNLLTVINGYTALMLAHLDEEDPFYGRLTEVRRAGDRAASLTRQLLGFSRKHPADLRPIDLNTLIGDEADMLRRLVGEDIQLVLQPAVEPGGVMADPNHVQQIVMNLVVNARDAMPRGGWLSIDISLADSMEGVSATAFPEVAAGPYVVLSVTDSGIGMSEQVRAQAFEPFFTTKPEGQGTGLGLSTVYGIVRQYGGWIALRSEPGAGSTFRIGFPRVATAAVAAASPAPFSRAALRGSETVLVLEDQDEVRRLASAMLRRFGYRVLEAAGGEDALHIAAQHPGPIHLVLTDIVMPRLSGPEVVAKLAPLRPEMRVLYMTGYSGDAIAQRGLASLGAPCILKPFTLEDLGQKVRAVLGLNPDATRILVVDDDTGNRQFFRSVLESEGYAVAEAADGSDALSTIAKSDPFAVIIAELVMPERDGLDMIAQLRKDGNRTRIIAVSGAFGPTMLACATKVGADATLSKPVRPANLVATVRKLVG